MYIPFVNYLLMCLCIIIILAFQTSNRLGQAYGVPTHCSLNASAMRASISPHAFPCVEQFVRVLAAAH